MIVLGNGIKVIRNTLAIIDVHHGGIYIAMCLLYINASGAFGCISVGDMSHM